MKPVIALVGRPNVGKSTLFNCLTRTRDALVADQPGMTRDRKYGEGRVGDRPYLVIDTGGLSGNETGVEALMAEQVWAAVDEADVVFFVVDARDGLLATDLQIADRLRRSGKRITLVVNKIDGVNADLVLADFFRLGFNEPYAIAAAHGHGVADVMSEVLGALPAAEAQEEPDVTGIKVAIVGRPNVGKSTLVNRMLGEERVLVFDMPGTTRDSIYVPFERDGVRYTLIDTAGVRRRSRVDDVMEKFSVIKSLQAIAECHVVIMVLDARQEVSDQDAHLLGFVLDAGKALVIAVNKWDGLDHEQKDQIKAQLERKLGFVSFAKIHFVSALHGTGVGTLFQSVKRAYESSVCDMSTTRLTQLLEEAVDTHQPPLVRGRRIKLRYAHQGGRNPPVIVIHGNQTEQVPESYKRFLVGVFRAALKLEGTPIRIEFKTGANPFKGRRNTLTPKQVQQRKRLMRFAKSKR